MRTPSPLPTLVCYLCTRVCGEAPAAAGSPKDPLPAVAGPRAARHRNLLTGQELSLSPSSLRALACGAHWDAGAPAPASLWAARHCSTCECLRARAPSPPPAGGQLQVPPLWVLQEAAACVCFLDGVRSWGSWARSLGKGRAKARPARR